MTIIKQRAVTEKGHQRNLRAYINDDKKVLLRDSQNMEDCKNLNRWATFMEETRKAFGHDKAARRVRDKKTGELVQAKNTIMYHQILAFLPDECDINGGKLSPEDCMRYAKEYVRRHYPNQQVVLALHNEYCKEDKTHRYAVHMVINRSDLSTGKRLAEGLSKSAKVERASRIRKMDKAWGLKQVERDERNSSVHKKQPSKVEKEIEGRGGKSYKTNLRELCRIAAERSQDIYEYREMLEGWGVDTQFRKGRLYVTDTDNSKYSFSLAKLDADLNQNGLNRTFRANVVADIREKGRQAHEERVAVEAERQRVTGIRDAYLEEMRKTYLDYRKKAHGLEGTALAAFPKLELKRPPKEVVDDPEVKRLWLAYRRGADELRVEMASEVPYARKPKKGGGTSGSGSQPRREAPSMGKDERGHERTDVR